MESLGIGYPKNANHSLVSAISDVPSVEPCVRPRIARLRPAGAPAVAGVLRPAPAAAAVAHGAFAGGVRGSHDAKLTEPYCGRNPRPALKPCETIVGLYLN